MENPPTAVSGASRGASPSWPARWLPAPGRRPRGGDTSTGPLPGPASLAAPAPRTPGCPAACGSPPRPSSWLWLEGSPCAPHTSPPCPGDPALNQQSAPGPPTSSAIVAVMGPGVQGGRGAPPCLQSPPPALPVLCWHGEASGWARDSGPGTHRQGDRAWPGRVRGRCANLPHGPTLCRVRRGSLARKTTGGRTHRSLPPLRTTWGLQGAGENRVGQRRASQCFIAGLPEASRSF